MHFDFTGQTALVTGGTRGIGRQIADDLHRLGASVIVTGTKQADVDRLNDAADERTTYHRADFTDRESLDRFLATLDGYARIDVCVHNAGINRIDDVDEVKDEDWDDIVAVNLRAPALITRSVARIMKRHRYGRIVNIASVWGHIGRPKRATYAQTKFGIRGLGVVAGGELAPYNILVNTVSPGFTLTDLLALNYSDEELRAIEAEIPIGRLAKPEEISAVVVFLASSLNSYVTGQSLVVDGGFVSV